jgi:hypothetical protein
MGRFGNSSLKFVQIFLFVSLFAITCFSGETIADVIKLPDASYVPMVVRGAAVTFLDNGMLLVTGGRTEDGIPTRFASIYDPSGRGEHFGCKVATSFLVTSRAYHTSTRLTDGRVVISGGRGLDGKLLSSIEVFDPEQGKFLLSGNVLSGRAKHSVIDIGGNKLAIVGGKNEAALTSEIEIFSLDSGESEVIGSMTSGRINPALLLSGDKSKIFIGGGDSFLIEACSLASGKVNTVATLPVKFSSGIFTASDSMGFVLLAQDVSGYRFSYLAMNNPLPLGIRDRVTLNPSVFILGKQTLYADSITGELFGISETVDEVQESIDKSLARFRILLSAKLPEMPQSETSFKDIRLPVKWIHCVLSNSEFTLNDLERCLSEFNWIKENNRVSADESVYLDQVTYDILNNQLSLLVDVEVTEPADVQEGTNERPVLKDAWNSIEWLLQKAETGLLSSSLFQSLVTIPAGLIFEKETSLEKADLERVLALRNQYVVAGKFLNPLVGLFVEVLRKTIASQVLTDLTLTEDERQIAGSIGKVRPLIKGISVPGNTIVVEKGIEIPVDIKIETLPSGMGNIDLLSIHMPGFVKLSESGKLFTAEDSGVGPVLIRAGSFTAHTWISSLDEGLLTFNELQLAEVAPSEVSGDGGYTDGTTDGGNASGGDDYTYDDGAASGGDAAYTYDDGAASGGDDYTYDDGAASGGDDYTYDDGAASGGDDYTYDDGAASGGDD